MTNKGPTFRRLLVGIIGGIVLLIGLLLIFLPGPAFIVIPAGLAILATEFSWAKELLAKIKKKFMTRVNHKANDAKTPSIKNGEQTNARRRS
jgi:uncharacterized protein (TIGR02611 family)